MLFHSFFRITNVTLPSPNPHFISTTAHANFYPARIQVAVKRLEQQGDLEEINLYNAREVFNLQGMRHPNVVNMLGVCKEDDDVYIVMEWMNKGNLLKYLRNREHAIPWRRRVRMGRDVARGIAYLHSQGLIHR